MGFSLETSVPVLTVFVQGLLSFFSPCVLPLVPLYVSYLAGGARTVGEDGTIHYPRGRVMVNTLFFVLGVSFTFVALGFGFTALGRFFSGNRVWFARVSGAIMILFGLYQLGVFGKSKAVEQEHRLPLRLDKWAMNPITALVLGFTFSFAWTPCVGPTLGSVLLMASSAGTAGAGFLLIGVYTLGFVIPFLAVGLFTGAVLDFFKRHQKVVRYTVKVRGCAADPHGRHDHHGLYERHYQLPLHRGGQHLPEPDRRFGPERKPESAGQGGTECRLLPG